MNHLQATLIVAAVVALGGIALPAGAALDPPSVGTGVSGHGKQVIIVTAGASGLPYGFTLRWMDDALFTAQGRLWPASPVPGEGRASFTGVPTLNTFNSAIQTFRVGPGATVMVEVGDLLQETGVTGTVDELRPGTMYHFAAYANGEPGGPASPLSVAVTDVTTPFTGCTYTPGYWKNHREAWPVQSLTLGAVTYSAEQLLAILQTSVKGNGLVSVAHHLIATKLNAANGSSDVPEWFVSMTDALIGNLVIPPVGNGYLSPSKTAGYTQVLDDYNNGLIGPGHCDSVVPTQSKTWGGVKALYR